MPLRCLLFTTDDASAHAIGQALAELGIEEEHCPEALQAVEKVTNQPFQIVIVDWTNQPEAGFLLQTARELKAAQRPLTLAIVPDEASVPQALQAGANSILRKPIVPNQLRDTLSTARDLLRSKQEPAAARPKPLAPSVRAITPAAAPAPEKTLRFGEFLNAGGPTPSAQFDTDSDIHSATLSSPPEPIDPLSDLEPMAASVQAAEPEPPSEPEPEKPRGLSSYLKARPRTLFHKPENAPASAYGATAGPAIISALDQPREQPAIQEPSHGAQSPAKPASTFATATLAPYIKPAPAVEESREELAPESLEQVRPRLGGRAILFAALVLACSIAIFAVPEKRWPANVKLIRASALHAARAWLNPQPVIPPAVPTSHERFTHAGDEYKLPVAEAMPDASTDPSQIQVLAVPEPVAPKSTGSPANSANPNVVPDPSPAVTPAQPDQTPGQAVATPDAAPAKEGAPGEPPPSDPPEAANQPQPKAVIVTTAGSANRPPVQTAQQSQGVRLPASTASIPSSLKGQIASMTPEASGTRPPEAAMTSIEPVLLPEATSRGLLLQPVEPVYPEAAQRSSLQGSVALQVLVGRDGGVQNVKFLQGSLAFARSAIDAVQQWRFKPYLMNGRPVQVQTVITVNFKPRP